MKQKAALSLTASFSVILASCASTDLTQIANSMIADATNGISSATSGLSAVTNGLAIPPAVTKSTKGPQPTKIKLSKSRESINFYWKSGTPYADLGDEFGHTAGTKTRGGYAFSPRQYRLLTLTIDFNLKTYHSEDTGLRTTERGTVTFLR